METAVPEESAEVEEQATDEVAEETQDVEGQETSDDAPAEDAAPEKPKKTAQQRINEITRKYREEERARQRDREEAEYWKNLAMRGGNQVEQPKMNQPQPTGRPQVTEFESQEDYEDALLNWNYQQRQAQEAEYQSKQQQEQARANFEKKADKIRAEHDDFDDVIANPVYSKEMQEALLVADNGPEVAYFLGKFENHDRAEEIRSLPPAAQIYALGQLGHELKLNKKIKKTTNAPAPIKPVGMTGSPPVDSSKLSMAEWYAREEEKRLAKLKEMYS